MPLQLPTAAFNTLFNEAVSHKETFDILHKRDKRKGIFNDGELIVYETYGDANKKESIFTDEFNKFGKQQAIAVISSIKKGVNNYIKEHGDKVPPPITLTHQTRNTNRELFESLKIDDVFFGVDIDRCFLQVMLKKGMINRQTFDKYFSQKEYKSLVNKSIGCIKNSTQVLYRYYLGCLRERQILNYTSYNDVHKLIINTAYKLIIDLYAQIPDGVIRYNTDAIYVLPDYLKTVKEYFKEREYVFKIERCSKVSQETYLAGGKLRKI